MRRWLIVFVLFTTTCQPTSHTALKRRLAPAVCGAAASQVVVEINRERAANGLAALNEDTRLDDFALNWTNQMAASNTLSHNPDGLSGSRRVTNSTGIAGENVDQDTSVADGMKALYASPNHKANTLNSQFTAVGAGVVQASNGQTWITENFVDRNSDHVTPHTEPPATEPRPTATSVFVEPTTTVRAVPTTYVVPKLPNLC